MTDLVNSYRTQAEKAMAEADAATLANVRDRNLRAAQAWTQMAERQERTERGRAARDGAAQARAEVARARD
jgi:hypothetical protein